MMYTLWHQQYPNNSPFRQSAPIHLAYPVNSSPIIIHPWTILSPLFSDDIFCLYLLSKTFHNQDVFLGLKNYAMRIVQVWKQMEGELSGLGIDLWTNHPQNFLPIIFATLDISPPIFCHTRHFPSRWQKDWRGNVWGGKKDGRGFVRTPSKTTFKTKSLCLVEMCCLKWKNAVLIIS